MLDENNESLPDVINRKPERNSKSQPLFNDKY